MKGKKVMTLPEPYHTEACMLFCTWLHRLEERDRQKKEKLKLEGEVIEQDSAIQHISGRNRVSFLERDSEVEPEAFFPFLYGD